MSLRRQIRIFLWFVKETFTRHSRLIIFFIVFGVLLLLFASKIVPKFSDSREKLVVTGVIGLYTEDNLPMEIQKLMSMGLTDLTPTGEATGSLASWWEIQDSGKTYIFHLKEGIQWQDGKVFNARVVVDNFYSLYGLRDVVADMPNFYTLKFKLKDLYSPFPTILSRPLFQKNLVGLGEYRVSEVLTMDDGEHLLRLLLVPKNTKLPVRLYKFYPTEKAAVIAFKLGEIDNLSGISEIKVFENWPNLKVNQRVNYQKMVAVYFNTKDPMLTNRALRQALTYAVPDSSFSDEEMAFGPISKSSWAYYEGEKRYNYDLEQAKKLFLKSGNEGLSEESKDKKEQKSSTPSSELKITLTTTSAYERIANEIKKSWDGLGVNTTVLVVSRPPENFQALLAMMMLPADPDQYAFWHSTQKTNITGLARPKIDQTLEEGRKVMDKEDRKKKYTEFQKILVDEAPAAFLFYPREYSISRL